MTDQSRTPRMTKAASLPIGGERNEAILFEGCKLELENADLRERLAKAREEAIEECARHLEELTPGSGTMAEFYAGKLRALSQKGADHE